MSLTYEEFSTQARELVKISDSIDDGWRLCEVPDGNCYLYKRRYRCSTPDVNRSAIQCPEADAGFHDAQVSQELGEHREVFVWEYNVAYNISYGVPALYFNISELGSGAPLTLDEVWKFCRKSGALFGMNKEDLWSTITQQEHPVTGVPHFALHPCNTQKMMHQLHQEFKKELYLLTWLSSVGPAVSIRMPLDYLEFV